MALSTRGMKIGILTAGGDCPGINAAIRGVGKTAITEYGMKVIGIASGFRGLIDKEYMELDETQLSGMLTLGGTILGTSRDKPFKNDPVTGENMSKIIRKNSRTNRRPVHKLTVWGSPVSTGWIWCAWWPSSQ